MKDHVCEENKECICFGWKNEPDERCPQHGAGSWPPRCDTCGRFMKWPERMTTPEYKAEVKRIVDDATESLKF